MIDTSHCYRLFGRAACLDKRLLRKAYAKLIKQYRPETHPTAFMEIHERYQEALELLKLLALAEKQRKEQEAAVMCLLRPGPRPDLHRRIG